MTWLQENWIIAVVGLVVAVVLLWWLFGRSKPEEIAPPTVVEPAKPAKPLEPVKPEIIAAEPARFKPIEPKAPPVAPAAPPPAPEPVAKAAPPPPEPVPAPKPAPAAKPAVEAASPAPKPAAKPKAAAKPAAKKTTAKEPAAKPAAKKATKPAPAKAAAAIPEEPTVPPPPAAKPAAKPAPAPAKTGADNLQLLKGVGPKLAVLLGGLGVTSFQQIADWTDADIARIDPELGTFQGRIARDNIVDQAGYLARGDKAGFEAKYGALGGEL
jgi:predicted flap endonuclease-1-like 5' DNA nuclease